MDYDKNGESDRCDYPCGGDDMGTCGGYDTFNLYETARPYSPDDPFLGCIKDVKSDRILSDVISSGGMTTDVSAVIFAIIYSVLLLEFVAVAVATIDIYCISKYYFCRATKYDKLSTDGSQVIV